MLTRTQFAWRVPVAAVTNPDAGVLGKSFDYDFRCYWDPERYKGDVIKIAVRAELNGITKRLHEVVGEPVLLLPDPALEAEAV